MGTSPAQLKCHWLVDPCTHVVILLCGKDVWSIFNSCCFDSSSAKTPSSPGKKTRSAPLESASLAANVPPAGHRALLARDNSLQSS